MKKIVIFISVAILVVIFIGCSKPTAEEVRLRNSMLKDFETVERGDLMVMKGGEILAVYHSNRGANIRLVAFGLGAENFDALILAKIVSKIIRKDNPKYSEALKKYVTFEKYNVAYNQ